MTLKVNYDYFSGVGGIAPNGSGLNAVAAYTHKTMNEGMNINNSTQASTRHDTSHCRFSPCYAPVRTLTDKLQ